MTTLIQAIQRNRQRGKYIRVLWKLRLRVFDYEDAGRSAEFERVEAKIIARIQKTL